MELNYIAEWFQFADSDLASAEFLQGMYPTIYEICLAQSGSERRGGVRPAVWVKL
jgi:hypothetical protein